MPERYQVAIIGGGPVGVALAVELGQRGISCAVIERHLEPQRIPKGQNLTNRTLEHFYFWNCVDELRDARVMPKGYPIGGMVAYDNLMTDYWYSQGLGGGAGRGEGVAQYYFQANERLPQYLTEEVLRARVKELPSVTTLYGWHAGSFDQDEHGVRVSIRPASEDAFYSWSSGAAQTPGAGVGSTLEGRVIEADYLVGCDGGRSLVRESLGIDRSGPDWDTRMLLAVFRSKDLHEGLKRYPDRTTFRVLKPENKGAWSFFGRIDVGEGFFFHTPVPKGTTADNFDFEALVQESAGFPARCDFEHIGFWDLRVAVADEYRRGRVFIAGDACHTHPPYGGFGLNSGLEDITNLGWKLAANLQGWGGDELLESYGEERRPIFVETGQVMIADRIEKDAEFLAQYSPAKDRAAFEQAWREHGEAGDGPGSYEPHYEGSRVVMGPPDAECSIKGHYTHAAEAGHHLPPAPLSNGRSTYEDLGPGFTLLAFDAGDTSVASIENAAQALGIPLKVVRDTYDAERAAYAARLILVRPDQYVVWTGDTAPADATAVLKRVTGQI